MSLTTCGFSGNKIDSPSILGMLNPILHRLERQACNVAALGVQEKSKLESSPESCSSPDVDLVDVRARFLACLIGVSAGPRLVSLVLTEEGGSR